MKGKVAAVTLLVAVAAFLLASHGPLGQALWPAPVPLVTPPTEFEVMLFMLLDVFDALALGVGVAFILFGWSTVKRVAAPSMGRAAIMYVSTAWFLTNWWMHDNIHMVTGLRPGGLLATEYAFHVTLMVSGAALAYAFATAAKQEPKGARV